MIRRTAEIQISSNANEVQSDIDGLSGSLNSLASNTASAAPIDALSSSTQRLAGANTNLTAATRESGSAVLANGGAIALLDAATGGMASVVRDTVEASGLFTNGLKLQTIWQGISTTVIGGTTGALKLFRIALISTGIGAIVVGLGLLIANFSTVSEWVQKTTDKFGGWRNVLMFVAPPIWLIIKALEALGVMETESEEKSRRAWEARQKRNEEATKAVMKQRQIISDHMDFEIAKANALGKDTVILEKVKREAILNTAKAYNDLNKELIFSGKATQDQIKAWNANQELIKKTRNDGILADLRVQKISEDKAKEARDKANEDAKKSAADRKALREKATADAIAEKKREDEAYKNAQIKLNKELEDLQDTTDQQKLDRMKSRYVEEINALKGKTAEEKAVLIASLNEQFKIRQADLDKKTKEEADKKEEERQKSIQDLIDKNAQDKAFGDQKTLADVEALRLLNQQKLNQQELDDLAAAEKLNATSEELYLIRKGYNDLEVQNNREAYEAGKALKEEEKKQLNEKVAAIGTGLAQASKLLGEHTAAGKAAAIASATIETYQSATSSYNSLSGIPIVGPVLGGIAAAAAVAAGMANVKAILKVKTPGGGGGSAGSSPSVPSIAKPSVSFQNTQQGQVSESIQQTSANRNAQPIQVQVSSNEITNAQRVDSETISNARYN